MSYELVLIGLVRIHQLMRGTLPIRQGSDLMCSALQVEQPTDQSQSKDLRRCSFEPSGWDVGPFTPENVVLIAEHSVGGLGSTGNTLVLLKDQADI